MRDAGGGGGLSSRRAVTIATGSLANAASENGSTDFGAPAQFLLTIEADPRCWVRFYATSASRTADLARTSDTDPDAGAGVLGDFIWLTTHEKIVSPAVLLFNTDVSVANTIYWRIQNLSGSTSTVLITMSVLSVEA